ncbi:Predicted secreted Zn-dependent protease [Sulfitobacter brevis]|uniref:Predicted secreted Zn-dependent protease n=1 Tax=Sulfitobacter brevis TaxID=74348 RepID=A0A1I1Y3Q4_9RHOB|nr:DUF922 domain-containing protein [Sulfitobacter brevis]SFE14184.1 Predicted secreted Zn-dependent protease [Sulfitobacter brevis]
MTRLFQSITTAAALVLAFAGTSIAEPKVSQQTKVYEVTATSVNGLIEQMNKRGPRGYWAFTEWHVRWSRSCKLEVDVAYILPQHANPSAMPAQVRRKFDAMLTALTQHEAQHGLHSIQAAREIEADKCQNGDAIIRRYNAADIAFDAQTNHGVKDGATLR